MRKLKYGDASEIEKLEKAAGISDTGSVTNVPNVGTEMPSAIPKIPVAPKPKQFKPGKMYPLTDLLDNRTLMDRSTSGSPPYTDAELKQGYRKMGKGLGK